MMIFVMVILIVVLLLMFLMARRFAAIVVVVSPDKASRKQYRDCAQHDCQFQNRPFAFIHRVSSGDDETAWSSKGNDARIDGELHQGFCPGLGASAVNTLDQAAERQQLLLEVVFHESTIRRNVAQGYKVLTPSGVAIQFRVCIFNPETLSKTVRNMRRQYFGSRGSVRVLRTPGVLISLLVAGFAAIFFPGLARAQTGTVFFSQTPYTAFVSQSNALITVILSGTTDQTAAVDFMTTNGTALAGVAYTAVSNKLNFAGGLLTNNVNVPLRNNGIPGSTQTVNLVLLNPTGSAALGVPSTDVLNIINDEMEQLQFAQASFSADDTDTVATITVVRIGATNVAVAVNFSTSDGSARNGIDYTMATGTVTFADGVVTNTFTIPIVAHPPGTLETNQTVNVTLTTPTGGATLGSPINAQLIIVATGPPVIQLSAANLNVHEHVGHATISALRFGNAGVTARVDYATSDGTASNGIDYFSTSGNLVFAPGIARSSFSFAFQKFKTFQSNKTVNVTLINPVNSSLGTQTVEVVTIVNDEPQTITFTNAGGGVVTLLLKTAGAMSVSQNEPLLLALAATDEGSTLTIKVKKSRTGTGTLQIDQITGDGSCGLIDAGDFDFVGAGIAMDGVLKALKIHDLLSNGVIMASGSGLQNTSILAHNLDDGCAINLGSRLKSLRAARFGVGATIVAPAIGAITIKGDRRNAIPGDFRGTITVSGDGIATNQNALGKLAVSGTMSTATVAVANGSVGSISAFQMIDSAVFVGYTPTVPGNPILGGGTFVADLRLGSVGTRSISNGFVNSDIAASEVGQVSLSSVVTDNGGLGFGVAASQHIGGVMVKTPAFHWMPSNPANDQSFGDFHVRH